MSGSIVVGEIFILLFLQRFMKPNKSSNFWWCIRGRIDKDMHAIVKLQSSLLVLGYKTTFAQAIYLGDITYLIASSLQEIY